MTSVMLPLAVHLSDGVLSPLWLGVGAVVSVLLMVPALLRVRDEEVPRIALLTATFFVASLLHVRIGPTSVHLLLNGLVGVVLGWRAALAIPVGLALQALLLGHGGFLTLGVNSVVLTVPALLMAGLFHLLRRVRWLGVFWLPDFAVGCVIGLVGVLLTLVLNALVLLYGGVEDWNAIVVLVFVAHLPVAVLETIIVGFTVSFLARVKPELLGELPPLPAAPVARAPTALAPPPTPGAIKGPSPIHEQPLHHMPGQTSALLLACASLLLLTSPALAHRLDADYRDLPDGRIQVESWFDSGGVPQRGTVQVFGADGKLLVEGPLDAEGKFIFQPDRSQELKVVVNGGTGHRKELVIAPQSAAPREQPAGRATPFPYKDALTGVALLLALGSFWMGLRNARELREIRRALTSARETLPPATPPTAQVPG